MKPSILKGMENILGASKINSYLDKIEDSLYIEDTFGRQIILGTYPNFKPEAFISGIPISIKGKLDDKGIFLFDDYLFYENININIKNDFIFNSPPIKESNNNKDGKLILFISNLKIGFPQDEIGFNESLRTLLIEFIQNRNNINNEFKNYSGKISRIILLGSSLNTGENELEKKMIYDNSSCSSMDNNILKNYISLNNFLNILSNYTYVDLMPSSDSNDDIFYPQKPLNKILFSENIKNINCSTLNLVSNPYFFQIQNNNKYINFVGTSGENIKIIKQYSYYNNNIEIMKKNLEWKHFCPMNPHNLNLYSPDNKSDPLLIQELPDVYFTSSDEINFKYEKVFIDNKQIILMSLPDFSKSAKCILFNCEDNTYKIIEFKFNI